MLVKINGDYVYEKESDGLLHSRSVTIIEKDIPREFFEESIRYLLGAFRSVFKAKKEILFTIENWKDNKMED